MPRLFTVTHLFVAAAILLAAACTPEPENIFEAVANNNHQYVSKWLENGGNPDLVSESKESLLYIATGPHGGHEVLKLLLEACANPNLGAYGYTPYERW